MCNDTYDNKSFAPKPVHKNEELSPEEDLDEWLKAEMEKRMSGHDKESEEDTLIDILKSLVGECKEKHLGTISEALTCQLTPKILGSFTLPCTIGNLNLYAMVDLGASVNELEGIVIDDTTHEMAILRSRNEALIKDACHDANGWIFSALDLVPHPSDTYVFTMKMEILLESASNKLLVAFKIRHNMRMLVKDTRSQDGKDDKDNDKGSKSRSQSMKEQAYNKEQRERPRPHELNDKSNLIDLMKECHQ
ncbi:hypothetical protein Tco_0211736 [Tanacetum coccineum]